MTTAPAHPRWWLRGALLTTAVALLVVTLFFAGVRSVRFDGISVVTFPARADAVTLPTFGAHGSHVLLYQHGETVTFSFPVHNDGRVPATVTGVRLTHDRLSMLQPEGVTADGHPLPVRLGPGDSTILRVIARYGNCRYYHEREVQSLSTVMLDVSVLGVHGTRQVALDHDLVIHSPMIVDCPDRTLDRNDDPRPNPIARQ